MKKLILFTLIILCTSITYSQDLKVKWEDDDGREFSIKVLSGKFSYGMIAGDDIKYDIYKTRITKVGDVSIKYDTYGKRVVKVGDVSIKWDTYGKIIKKVGGLTIKYDTYNVRIKGTEGKVR